MALFDQTFKDEVRSKNDIVEVISSYVKLERRGNRFVGLCPFHGEKTPSFHVIPDMQIYHCFGCKVSGDVFKFVQEREHLSFYEVVVYLAKRARIPLPKEERTPEEEKAYRERRGMFDALEFAVRFYHDQLYTEAGKNGLNYLLGRGLTEETIRRFRLGWAPGYGLLYRAMRNRFHPDLLVKVGLALSRKDGKGYMDAFYERVMFPITDLTGRVLGFGGRILEGAGAKYKNTADTPLFAKRHVLFGLSQAKEAMRTKNQAVLVEGYMDVIMPHQVGITNVVAPLGTALTDEQCLELHRQAQQVIVAFDSDTAGQMATLRGLEKLYDTGCDVRILQLPEGKDPDEFIRANGVEGFRRCIDEAIPLVEFKLALALARFPHNTPEAKTEALEAVARVLVDLKNEVLREDYTRLVATKLATTPGEVTDLKVAIAKQMNRLLRQGFQHNQTNSRNNIRDLGGPSQTQYVQPLVESKQPQSGGGRARQVTTPADLAWKAEQTLVRLLLQYPGLLGRIDTELGDQPFDDAAHSLVLAAIRQICAQGIGDGGHAARLLDILSDPDARQVVTDMAVSPLISANVDQEAGDCIVKLKQHRVSRRIEDLEKLFMTAATAGQRVPDAVLQEYMQLQQQIRATKS